MKLELTPDEIAGVVEALHDGILRRVAWSTTRHSSGWRNLDISIVQMVLDKMTSAYAKTVMMCREEGIGIAADLVGHFEFSQGVWDILDNITMAKSWDDIPFHEFHPNKGDCETCDTIYGRT